MLLETFRGTYWEPLKNLIGKHNDTPPFFLKDSNASPKVETMEEEGMEIYFLIYNISKVEECVETSK